MAQTNRQIILKEIPQGKLSPDNFRLATSAPPSPGEGELLLRTRYISLDAANRAWMQGATYRSALESGQVMAGGALAEVAESKAPGFAAGDLVWAETGWQDYAVVPARQAAKLPKMEPLSHLVGIYGITGLTAYLGLMEIGRPKAGETVVVSAAAGAVGSVVGQVAKLSGCRVVGIAGGADKCAWLTDELGLDAAVDYKAGGLRRALREVCPDGVNVFFDNVGGDVFEAVLFNMANHGRIVCCGAVSQYDGAPPPHGPRGVPGLFVTKRLRVEGFVVMDLYAKRDEALAQLKAWVESGQLKVLEDVIDGLENLPTALIGLLAGENRGKRMVKVV
ncbi:MAG: NADP-dependent oxidoreductase [Caulobacterales bacterium]